MSRGSAALQIAQLQSSGRLTSWQFDPRQNRLEFRTTGGVQPRAQLITDPTRLVIDLPGISLGRPGVTQALNDPFRALRVGQFDRLTTRIVIELAPGYTLDSQQIRFRGLNPTQWTVQLPRPQFGNADNAVQPLGSSPPLGVSQLPRGMTPLLRFRIFG